MRYLEEGSRTTNGIVLLIKNKGQRLDDAKHLKEYSRERFLDDYTDDYIASRRSKEREWETIKSVLKDLA